MPWSTFFALLIGLAVGTWGGPYLLDACRETWTTHHPHPPVTIRGVARPHVRILPAPYDQDRHP